MRPLALTMGDPSGIGIEISLKAWVQHRDSLPAFVLLADPDHIQRVARQSRMNLPVQIIASAQDSFNFSSSLPIIPLFHRVTANPGLPDVVDAPATLESLDRAIEAVRHGHVRALVTNPIAKEIIYQAGFEHPGHTEYLGHRASLLWGLPTRPVMMIWSSELATVPVTVHIPLRDIASTLTQELIIETIRVIGHDLRARFGIAEPRIAVAGLNPHAGENGHIGNEDRDIIAPALQALRREGLSIIGPLPADTMFHASARQNYDVAVGMYHDQALIPVKMLSFDSGVNVTLGLPFVRTSPDHGTAFNIAGTGQARPDSLIAALRLADRLS